MKKSLVLISALSVTLLASCGDSTQSSQDNLSHSNESTSSVQSEAVSSESPEIESIDLSRGEEEIESEPETTEASHGQMEIASSESPIEIVSEPASSEIVTDQGIAFADVIEVANSLDQNANFEIEFNRITDYGGGSTETTHETGFVGGNEYLGYDDPNYPVYMVLDEDGTNHRYYELSYGAGFNDHKEYWAYSKFNTAFFISGYNYGFMTKTLSSLLSEFGDSFEAISDEGKDAFVSDSAVVIPFDLEFAAEYARKSDWTSFSYFAKESYPDWELDDFKIVPTIEQGEIVSLTISYNAKAVWGEYGNSGKVDFNISEYARFETSIVFSNFGGVTITPPEGVNRQ